MELAQDCLHCQGLLLLGLNLQILLPQGQFFIMVLQSNDCIFTELFLQVRPSQFFYDVDSPTDEGNQRKKARKDNKQQRKRQPPKFDQGSVVFSWYALNTQCAHCGQSPHSYPRVQVPDCNRQLVQLYETGQLQ